LDSAATSNRPRRGIAARRGTRSLAPSVVADRGISGDDDPRAGFEAGTQLGSIQVMDQSASPPEMTDSGPARILLIEDNAHYATALRNNLEIDGFAVDLAPNAAVGLQLLQSRRPALVLLDVMLPGHDGYHILKQMRDSGIDIPVVILTARRDETDKLRGFGLGADDFITKPVSILELIARVRAVLRRAHPRAESVALWIRFGDIEVHPGTRTVRRRGQEIELRPKEFDLLLALLRHQERIVSRAELLRDVWGYQADTVSRTVDTHMAGLRQKLEDDPLDPRYFITVRSVGYMMRRSADQTTSSKIDEDRER
jgi:DNA-binding response OmpR family regulator